MKNRNDIDALKQLFVEHSEPNEKNIKNKIEFNIDSNQKSIFTDILVKTRVRNILIILITIVLISAISLTMVFTMNFAPENIVKNTINENSMRYFDESKAVWEYNFDIGKYNRTNSAQIMKFYNYDEILSAQASNIDGFFHSQYEGINNDTLLKINMYVYLENKLSTKFQRYTNFENSINWNNYNVKFEIESMQNNMENVFKIYFHDNVNNYNYTINIFCYGNTDISSQTLENTLTNLRIA